ncbi:MAG TPA: BTAD domain-containing putative transcriptional regulator, partial [Solirubrobacterales bacterium]|nr:BTAD domain-containing putative transcriptional regulator [Solirubrobacterales bacterium]
MFEFGVLGPLEATREGEPLRLGGGKQRALLAILLLNANAVVSSDRLIDELWGEAPPETAGKALQVHVSQLRKVLEPERGPGDPARVLITKPPGYLLSVEPDQLDLTRFERLTREGREALASGDPQRASRLLAEALSLWRGAPLADLAYEPFAQGATPPLEERRLAALEDRVEADFACGRDAELVGELEELIAAEPLRERPRGQLMLALYRSGRQAEALHAYRAARDVLVKELGIEPGRELHRLHEAILRQDPELDPGRERLVGAAAERETTQGSEPAGRAEEPFVGRERELSQLAAALDQALEGRGSVYLIGGEPGIGKSRLADELSALAREREARVLWGRCWEAGGAPAYWPWVQALRGYIADADAERLRVQLGAHGSEVAQLLPELRDRFPELPLPASPESEGARFRLFDATAGFISRVADDVPLVLVLDDLHAADTPSLLMLRFIAGELGGAAVLVLGTYRDVEVTPGHPLDAALDHLGRQQAAHLISLRGLKESEVSSLITVSAEVAPSRRAVSAIHRGTGGNPLFVEELVQLLVAEDRLEEATGEGAVRVGIPRGIQEVIGRRLERISADCRRALGVAAVLGRDFDLDDLAEVTQRPSPELLDVFDEAISERIVAEVSGMPHRLRFSHVLIRDVLYEELGASRRRRLHARAGEALETLHGRDLDPHLAELAHHFFAAGPAGDPARALGYARRAGGHAAGQLAYEEAARLYELGIGVLRTAGPGDEATRCELMLALAEARLHAGNEEESKAMSLTAAEIARRIGASEALGRAALSYGGVTVWSAARADPRLIPLLEEALASLPASDSSLRAKLIARLACAVRDQPDRDRRLPLSDEAVAMARRLGDPRTLAYVLDGRCIILTDPGSMERFTESAREVVALAEEIDEPERAFTGNLYLACSLLQAGDVEGMRRTLRTMSRVGDELKEPTYRWGSREFEAALALFEGRFDAAEALTLDAYEVGRHAVRFNAVSSYRLQRFLLHRERGGLERLEGDLRTGATETPTYHILRSALANLCIELGRADSARTVFEELARDDFEQVYRDEEFLASMTLLAEVCVSLADLERAARAYELLMPHAERNAFGLIEIVLGAVARPLGLLAGALGRTEEAIAHLEQALEMNAQMGARPWVAHTKYDLGRVLAQAGAARAGRSAALLDEALAEYRALGMTPWVRKAERELARLGAAT